MTQPLALLLYERLLPGSQLVNKLDDLHYRVQTLTDPRQAVGLAGQIRPMIVLVDVETGRPDMCESIASLRGNPTTSHLPVIAFGSDTTPEPLAAARSAGATLTVSDAAILNHLPQFLEQALDVQ